MAPPLKREIQSHRLDKEFQQLPVNLCSVYIFKIQLKATGISLLYLNECTDLVLTLVLDKPASIVQETWLLQSSVFSNPNPLTK